MTTQNSSTEALHRDYFSAHSDACILDLAAWLRAKYGDRFAAFPDYAKIVSDTNHGRDLIWAFTTHEFEAEVKGFIAGWGSREWRDLERLNRDVDFIEPYPESYQIDETLALYETEPIGVDGEHEAVTVFYFCEEACREQFQRNRNPDDKPLRVGTSPDAIEGTACDQCDRIVAKDFHLNLPVCCAAAVRAETQVFDGQIVECPKCQRAVVYHVTTGWTRYWKPCDRCLNPTSIERHNQAEPPEGEFCQTCGYWLCPDCKADHTDVPVPPEPKIDFSCRVCGVQCAIAPDPPARAVCPEHCEDHNYEHDPHRQGRFCSHCDEQEDYYGE